MLRHNAFLEETLASVVHQQYPPAEIIIVDDGSEDRCSKRNPDPTPHPGFEGEGDIGGPCSRVRVTGWG